MRNPRLLFSTIRNFQNYSLFKLGKHSVLNSTEISIKFEWKPKYSSNLNILSDKDKLPFIFFFFLQSLDRSNSSHPAYDRHILHTRPPYDFCCHHKFLTICRADSFRLLYIVYCSIDVYFLIYCESPVEHTIFIREKNRLRVASK